MRAENLFFPLRHCRKLIALQATGGVRAEPISEIQLRTAERRAERMSVTGTSRFGVSAILIALMAAVAGLAPSSPVSGGQATGVIQGKVKVASPPTPGTLETTTDQAVCGESVPDETVVADASGGVANAVVTVGGVPWPEGATVLVISNSGCRFVPHVQVARRPSTLQLTSEDQTLHTTHAYDDRNRTLFNVAIPLPGISIERPLQRPGIVRLECDSHAWMRGYVVVTWSDRHFLYQWE